MCHRVCSARKWYHTAAPCRYPGKPWFHFIVSPVVGPRVVVDTRHDRRCGAMRARVHLLRAGKGNEVAAMRGRDVVRVCRQRCVFWRVRRAEGDRWPPRIVGFPWHSVARRHAPAHRHRHPWLSPSDGCSMCNSPIVTRPSRSRGIRPRRSPSMEARHTITWICCPCTQSPVAFCSRLPEARVSRHRLRDDHRSPPPVGSLDRHGVGTDHRQERPPRCSS